MAMRRKSLRVRRRRRRSVVASRPWKLDERKTASLRAGIVGTILFHLLLVWLAPKFEHHYLQGPTSSAVTAEPAEQLFDIEVAPLPPPPPDTYVDANPDAPDNPPDETENFSDRNQQLAQEVAAEELGDMPSTEGEDDVESTSIVSGDDAEPTPPTALVPPAPETVESEAVEQQELPALAQDPLSGTEDIRGESETGVGTNVVEVPENPQADIDEAIEGVTDPEQASPTGRGIYYRPNPNQPAARPNLARSQVKPAIFSNRVTGTDNIGVIAHEALRTTFGDYFARILEVIRLGWVHDIRAKIERRLGFPLDGSRVQVWFTLHDDGSVTIDKVNGNAGPLWDGVAVEAIAAPARTSDGFGEWDDEMRVILGESTPIRLTFYYQ
ncbi:MAG: hypothetical protein SynsKO_45040 [Synoicihabitans sp.]